MTHTLIYPSNSRHNSAGHLEVDGCDVVELAEHYGTPLIVYEEKTIRDQCRRLEQGFSRRTDDYEVIYATKALCTIAICQLVAQEGLSLDVSSGGEYHTALKAGVPTERIFFHGNNKTRTELEYALDNGIGHVVIDSLQELELLEGLAVRPIPTSTSRQARRTPSSALGWWKAGRWKQLSAAVEQSIWIWWAFTPT